MSQTEIDNYIAKLEEQVRKQLRALEKSVSIRFEEKPVWNPATQDYDFYSLDGRKREFALMKKHAKFLSRQGKKRNLRSLNGRRH